VARSEEDVLSGVLRVVVGGRERELPVRSIASSRAWKLELTKAIAGNVGGMSLDSLEDGGAVANAIGDRILDLVVAYDEGAALGGREYLEEHATDREIYFAFRAILEATFPFVRDLRSILVELKALGLAELLSGRSVEPRSISSASGNGASEVLVASSSS
jgi:hypothetical protein